jgi:DNA invertase Pin-like site-specific DNA recombinase
VTQPVIATNISCFINNIRSTNNLLLMLLGAVAGFERSMIRERQREGIAIAKAKGGYAVAANRG